MGGKRITITSPCYSAACLESSHKWVLPTGRLIAIAIGLCQGDGIRELFKGFGDDSHLCGCQDVHDGECNVLSHHGWESNKANNKRKTYHLSFRGGNSIPDTICKPPCQEPVPIKAVSFRVDGIPWSFSLKPSRYGDLSRRVKTTLLFRDNNENISTAPIAKRTGSGTRRVVLLP